jgi:hypothetical protein
MKIIVRIDAEVKSPLNHPAEKRPVNSQIVIMTTISKAELKHSCQASAQRQKTPPLKMTTAETTKNRHLGMMYGPYPEKIRRGTKKASNIAPKTISIMPAVVLIPYTYATSCSWQEQLLTTSNHP